MRKIEMNMLRLLAAACAFASFAACAQEWPSKPIRLVIPYAAGGAGDITFRALMPAIEAKLGQRFVIDNKLGASGNVGAADVMRAAPDGHTLLLGATNNFATNQYLMKGMDFDPITAFAPVMLVSNTPTVIIVNNALPVKTLRELVSYAKANPGKLNYASPGNGTVAHLAGELFSEIAGIQMVHVPFKGAPPANNALLANEVQVFLTPLPSILGALKGGRVRAIATGAKARLEALPDVSTTTEQGMSELITGNWWGLVAPKATPARIVDRLAAEVRATLADPEVRKRYSEIGMEPGSGGPKELEALMKSEAARWKKVIDRAKVLVE